MKYSVESVLAAIAVLALLFFPKNHEDENKDRCDVLTTPFFTIRTGADGVEEAPSWLLG